VVNFYRNYRPGFSFRGIRFVEGGAAAEESSNGRI
jgi:hypothetical protein